MNRFLVAATFCIALATPVICQQPGGLSASATIESWSADQVRLWAVQGSTVANLLDAERVALGCQVQRGDSQQCAQIGLWQAVLRELAREDRNKSGGEAVSVYWRIVGLESQLNLLQQAEAELDDLAELSRAAESLSLPDGESEDLRYQQLELEDKRIQAEFALRKLRHLLAEKTKQPAEVAESAALTDTLGLKSMGADMAEAIAEAEANRGSLRAIRTLCRCMNENTLPAARQMLSILRPGIGISLAKSSKPFFSLLSIHDRRSNESRDLCSRRRQCWQLGQDTADMIRVQVVQARIDLDLAIARHELAEETASLARQNVDVKTMEVDLDQSPVGSDKLARLDALNADSEAIQRAVDSAVAEVALQQAMGKLAE